jgi:hypothetical protein
MFDYLKVVMERVKKYHLKINWKKCNGFVLKLSFWVRLLAMTQLRWIKKKLGF